MKLLLDDPDGYRQMLSSILWLAVYDACSKPVQRVTGRKWYRPTDHASSAIRFIFEEGSGSYFPKYIECLGMDAEAFRQKLVRTMYAQESLQHLPFGGLPDGAQKNFRFNHTYWLTEPHQKGDLYAALEQNRRNLEPSVVAHLDSFFGSDDGDQGATEDYSQGGLLTRPV